MPKLQDMAPKRANQQSGPAMGPAKDRGAAWLPVFRALRREFRESLSRIVAGNDPVARLLGYRNLMKVRYGVTLPDRAASPPSRIAPGAAGTPEVSDSTGDTTGEAGTGGERENTGLGEDSGDAD